MTLQEAQKCEPGFILDMHMIRFEYDARLAGIKLPQRMARVTDL